jgi:isopentenyldiphosphate isomerase
MEEFDLVDEKDSVIGTTNRQQSHTRGESHRAVAVFVFTPDGKLYLQEHLKSNNIYDHSIGGHVKKGESYNDAAKREAEEELGVIDPLTFLFNIHSIETRKNPHNKHMFAVYEVTPNSKWQFKENEEVKKIIPMEIKDIVDLMNKEPLKFTDGFINTMGEYLNVKDLPYNLTLS